MVKSSSLNSWNLLLKNGSKSHCKDWVGIYCENGSVTNLQLTQKNIVDGIPSFICDLKNLVEIDLSYNFILGEIPLSVFNCSNLKELDLSQNYLTGLIPDEFHRLHSLKFLVLYANNFTKDIPSIGGLPELIYLGLGQNLLNGSVSVEVRNLENLESPELANNDYKPWRIPSDFGRLKKLTLIWLMQTNLIGGIPETISDLIDLEHLDLSSNELSGVISDQLLQLILFSLGKCMWVAREGKIVQIVLKTEST